MPNTIIIPAQQASFVAQTKYHWMYDADGYALATEEYAAKDLDTSCSWGVPGKNRSKCGTFNGTNDMSLLNSSVFNLGTNSASWAAWVYPQDNNPLWIHSKGSYASSFDGYVFSVSTTYIRCMVAAGTGGSASEAYVSVTLPLDTWSHVACSVDKTDGHVKGYVGGRYIGEDIEAGMIGVDTDNARVYWQMRTVGVTASQEYSYGKLQDVWFIKNYILTAADALQLYKYLA
jgi:hypothetical protein